MRVKISQDEYESGITDCKRKLHGKLTLNKWDSSLTTKALKMKLEGLWPLLTNWSVIPLGKGFYEFKCHSVEDMRNIWALGDVNLKLGILKFYGWTRDFIAQHQVQTHALLWILLMHFSQEYWRKKTLYEITYWNPFDYR